MKYSLFNEIIRLKKKFIILILIIISIIINISIIFFNFNNLGLLSKFVKMSKQEREISGEYNIQFYSTIMEVKNVAKEKDSLLLLAPQQYYEYYLYKLNYYLYPIQINLLTFNTNLDVEILLLKLSAITQSKKPTLVLIINNGSFTDIFPVSNPKFDREFLPKIERELSDYNLAFSHWDQFLYVSR